MQLGWRWWKGNWLSWKPRPGSITTAATSTEHSSRNCRIFNRTLSEDL